MKKLNLNPKGLKTGDCVIRAIAYATEQSWDKVYEDLCKIGLKMKRLPNEKQVFSKYLEDLGWKKFKQPRNWDNTKLEVCEFIEKEATFLKTIISLPGHLTVIDNYEIVDTWDCSHKKVGNYWVKREN